MNTNLLEQIEEIRDTLEGIKNNLSVVHEKLPLLLEGYSEYLTDANKGIVKFKKKGDEYLIVYASSNLVKFLNLTLSEALGLNVLDFHNTEERNVIIKEIDLIKDNVPITKEYEVKALGRHLKIKSKLIKEGDLYTEFIEIL